MAHGAAAALAASPHQHTGSANPRGAGRAPAFVERAATVSEVISEVDVTLP